MHVLLATDASPEALAAVRFGMLLQSSLGAEITLLSVAANAEQAAAARMEVEKLIKLHESLQRASSMIRRGHAAEQILKEVERGNYDLLIIGSRGQSRVSRFLLGDTALRLARECRIPLIIVHRAPEQLQRLLICTAGGDHGRLDTQFAAEIAAATKAELTVLHVMSQIDIAPGDERDKMHHSVAWHIEHRTAEGLHLEELVAIAASFGVRANPIIRYGLVVEEILAEAREQNYDLVVVGAHGVQGLTRFLLDDVTEAIITNLSRPVLVVR